MLGSSSAISTLRGTLGLCSRDALERRRLSEREGEREARALAAPAGHPDAAAEVLHDAAADMQAEAAALRLAGERVARLPEFVEDPLLVLGSDPGAVVTHVDAQALPLLDEGHFHPAA